MKITESDIKIKAIGLAKRIAHSDQLRTAFAESCEHVKIKHLGLKRPVATRWNTQIECLERELTQKEAVIRLCENPIYARFDLEKYSLSPREWETLEHLKSPLAVCVCGFLQRLLTIDFYIDV